MGLRTRPIDGELLRLKEEIEGYARSYGLDFYPVVFEVCDYDTISILAAQSGFPARYPHWSFGMEYDQLSKGYTYGLQRIYEMVINTNPCYAYLLSANHMVDQKLVMAHVYGHADFFKHNAWFKNTDKNMMDVMANHGTKIRRYMTTYGVDKVEAFIDRVLSLENLLDVNCLFDLSEKKVVNETQEDIDADNYDERSLVLKSFMRSKDRYSETQKKVVTKIDQDETKKQVSRVKFPVRDVMKFLMENAPLEEWQADIVGILREEAVYFLPQRMTKIMNEGWASYWHSTIMTKNALKASEIIDFADRHSSVMAMSKQNINPYKIGIELMRDIEFRWDTGRFGKEYLECDDMQIKEKWDKKLGLGRQKIFEVRKSHNDLTFIDEFFTEEFCNRMQIFTYKYNPRTGRNEIETRDFMAIKEKLLSQLTNFGQPLIEIIDDNHNNRSELLLRHVHQGVDLDLNFASETMRNIYLIWSRPINLSTRYEDTEMIYQFDGKELKTVNK